MFGRIQSSLSGDQLNSDPFPPLVSVLWSKPKLASRSLVPILNRFYAEAILFFTIPFNKLS